MNKRDISKQDRIAKEKHAHDICKFIDDLGDLTEQYSDTLRDAEPFEMCGIIEFLINVHLNMGRFSIEELDAMDNRDYKKDFEKAIAEYCIDRALDAMLLELIKHTGGKKNG